MKEQMKQSQELVVTEHSYHASHTHEHTHIHEHAHQHDHGLFPVYLYVSGVIFYFIALLFPLSSVLQAIFYLLAMFTAGYHVIMEGFGETLTDSLNSRVFRPNVHILMTLAALGASIIGDFDEGALLILIFAGAHFLEEYAEGKSRREITNLLNLNPTEARLLKQDGTFELVAVTSLQIGDVLQVLPGDQIPTDGEILEGASTINEASITGESFPKDKLVGDDVYGSTVNGQGSFLMKVTKDSSDTVFAKILSLVNQSQTNLSKTATKIKRIEPIYVKIVLLIVPLFVVVTPPLLGWSWSTSFYRGMVLLIATSPCALAASAVPATLSGISNLAKKGVLFKGGSFLANLATIKAVAFDKTGTLTLGKPVVTDLFFSDSTDQPLHQEMIVAMEKTANHPLAEAILTKLGRQSSVQVVVENQIGRGLVTEFQGDRYQIGKPSTFKAVPIEIKTKEEEWVAEGKTVVFYAVNEQVLGIIGLMDLPNEQSKPVIDYLKQQGIHTVMITGDAKKTGEAVAAQLGMDEVVGNVLPENKAQIIQELQNEYGETVMIGDGINDAPALVQASIGFAMGDGTDIAIDVADAVIMQNSLSRFAYAHRLAKKLERVVWQNIVLSMVVVLLLVVLNSIGKMSIGVGVLAHEGSTLLVILNGLRLLLPLDDKN